MTKDKPLYSGVDWPFLFFVIGAVYVKTYVKVIAIIAYFIYLLLKKFSFPKINSSVIYFYLLMPVIGIIAPLLNGSFNVQGYLFGYLFGLMQWVISAAIFYLLYVTVKNKDREKLRGTISAFFVINVIVTFVQLILVMVASHSIMPYWIYDAAEKYGISTGDRLQGVFSNISLTNAAVCVLGGIYFLFNEKLVNSILCFVVMLLCTSNLSLFFSLFSLFLILCCHQVKAVKKESFYVLLLLLLIYPIVSPGNLRYISTIFNSFVLRKPTNYTNPDSLTIVGVNSFTKKHDDSLAQVGIQVPIVKMAFKLPLSEDQYAGISMLKDLADENQKYKDPQSSLALDQRLLKETFSKIYGIPVSEAPLSVYTKPGKVYALKQTYYFLCSNPKNLLFGAGTGNFSSKLAIKMTGLGLQGKYPQKYVYASTAFMENHLYSVFYYLCQNIALHSVLNMPNSVYNQVGGEYGFAGIALFILFYIGYFWKKRNKAGYGMYLLLTLLLFFGVDYWFEMMSLTVIFELLMLVDIFEYTNDANEIPFGNGVDAGI